MRNPDSLKIINFVENPYFQRIDISIVSSQSNDFSIEIYRIIDGISPEITAQLYDELIINNFNKEEREEKKDFQAFYEKIPELEERRENINIVAVSNSKFVGLLTGMAFHKSKLGYFDYLVVDESVRSKGVGGLLFQAGKLILRNIALEKSYTNDNLAVLLTVEKPDATMNLDKGQDSKKRLAFYNRQNCKRVSGMPCIVPEISNSETGEQKPAIDCYDWLIAGVNRDFQDGEVVMDRETALKFNIDNIDLQYDNHGLKAEETETYKKILSSLENVIYVEDLF